MKTYRVVVTETLQRTITINANNKEEAKDVAEERYRNEEIVLDSSD